MGIHVNYHSLPVCFTNTIDPGNLPAIAGSKKSLEISPCAAFNQVILFSTGGYLSSSQSLIRINLWHENSVGFEKKAMVLLQSAFNGTYLLFGLVALWLVVLILVLLSLWRRRDMILPKRLLWIAIIFFAPVVGLIFYLVAGAQRGPTSKV
jgi:hypothetical protein